MIKMNNYSAGDIIVARLSLFLLGPFYTTLDGVPVTDFGYDHVRALLSYLAVEADRPHRREALAGLLWPDQPDRTALHNLRHALHHLQRAIGSQQATPPFLLVSRDALQFNARSDHAVDALLFKGLVSARESASDELQRLEQAVGMYRGPFLQDFSLGSSYALEEWQLHKRAQLDRLMREALHQLAQAFGAQRGYERAEEYARRLLVLDPWDEPTHRQLMGLLALQGRRGAALAQYDTLRKLLQEEFGAEPEPETVALYARISGGQLDSLVNEPRLAQAPRPSAPAAPRFVGRDAELQRLSGCLDETLEGRGQVAFVTGEAGCGKSMLMAEFARRAMATHGQLVVACGSCSAQGGIGDPYLPFREILQSLCGDVTVPLPNGTIPRLYADRQWAIAPLAMQALVEVGPDLIHRLVSAGPLGLRAESLAQQRPHEMGRAPWFGQLEELLEHPRPAEGADALIAQADLFTQYTHVLQLIAQDRPLLLILDDLHWADLGTISLLFHLGRRLAGQRILILGACRPDEVAMGRDGQRHPLEAVANELRGAGEDCVNLEQSEGRAFIEALLDSEPNRLGAQFRETLYHHTRGHALFTVELLRSLQERGGLRYDSDGRWVAGPGLNWEALPPRVEVTIAERMALLPEAQRAILSVASVEGESFTAEVVARVRGMEEQQVCSCLSGELGARLRFVRAEELTWQGSQSLSRYRFRHQLFQQYLHDSLDAVERARLHGAVLAALEALHGSETEGLAGTLARHAEEAGMPLEAARHRLEAGRWAARLVAYEEAITHLERGLALLEGVAPSRGRLGLELGLWGAMVNPALVMGGWRAPAYTRALERLSDLTQHPELQDDPQRLAALSMLALLFTWSADPARGRRVGEQLLGLAHDENRGDRQSLMLAHWALGHSHWLQGRLVTARQHVERALALHDPGAGRHLSPVMGADAGVMGRALLGVTLWLLGYPDQGRAGLQQALARARAMEQPPSAAFAHVSAGMMHSILGRDVAAARSHGAAMRLLGQAGLFYGGFVEVLAGQASTEASGQAQDGQAGAVAPVPGLGQGLAQPAEAGSAPQTIGSGAGQAALLLVQAQMLAQAGQARIGLEAMDRALAWIERTGVRTMEAEVWRMRGELLLADRPHRSQRPVRSDGGDDEAEACFRRALEIARDQQARMFELRAALSLARLWQGQSRADEAREMLAGIYGWFSEGFDTPDLQEARAALEQMARPG